MQHARNSANGRRGSCLAGSSRSAALSATCCHPMDGGCETEVTRVWCSARFRSNVLALACFCQPPRQCSAARDISTDAPQILSVSYVSSCLDRRAPR